jgi:hypothetical protein
MSQGLANLTTSVQALPLTRGLHLVTITSASPRRFGDAGDMMVPAIHVGAGPGVPADHIQIMPGPRNNGDWLFETGDMLVIKVSAVQAMVLITTLRNGPTPAITVDVARLEASPGPAPAATPPLNPQLIAASPAPAALPMATVVSAPALPAHAPPPPPPLRTSQGEVALGVRVDLHLQIRGDVSYVNNFWAGALGERLAIEAFTITPLEGIRPNQLEYAGVSESGVETGWVEGGGLCGARGAATALMGFAIRLKGGDTAPYVCEYRGSFSSGRIVGPLRDGAPCRSSPGDRLEAIQLFILPRQPAHSAPPAITTTPAPQQGQPRQAGPKFSVFREASE